MKPNKPVRWADICRAAEMLGVVGAAKSQSAELHNFRHIRKLLDDNESVEKVSDAHHSLWRIKRA
jgi:hypothetical protein